MTTCVAEGTEQVGRLSHLMRLELQRVDPAEGACARIQQRWERNVCQSPLLREGLLRPLPHWARRLEAQEARVPTTIGGWASSAPAAPVPAASVPAVSIPVVSIPDGIRPTMELADVLVARATLGSRNRVDNQQLTTVVKVGETTWCRRGQTC